MWSTKLAKAVLAGFVAAIALAVTTGDALAQAGIQTASKFRWSEHRTKQRPAARINATMAYDPANEGLILFGGATDTAPRPNDTWLWNGHTWRSLAPAASPPGRELAAMAYDAATNQLVLFGGEGCTTGYCNDTWVWNGSTWVAQAPTTSPVGRVGAMMAYDASTQQLLLFGGQNPACNAFPPGGAQCRDTWSWNGSTWTELNASGPASGCCGSMAYDRNLGTVVRYGGDNANDTQTWTWTGTAWTLASATGPCNTSFNSMAGDNQGSVVLFGGYGFCLVQGITEEWNGTGWTTLPLSPSPSARAGAMMSFDPRRRETVLFGGASQGGALLNDTWGLR